MSIKVMITNDPGQIDTVLRVRHQVFCEEEGKLKITEDGRVVDRFDAYPTTHNLVVMSDSEVVGGMRLTLDSSAGLPVDEFYDFRSHLPSGSYVLNAGMYCVVKNARSSRAVFESILLAGCFAIAKGVTHVVAPVNPALAKLLGRVGFEALDGEIVAPNGLVIIPMMIDLKNMGCLFEKFIRNNQRYNLFNSYESHFFQEGESIVNRGESVDSAFVVIDGVASLLEPNSNQVLSVIREGEVVCGLDVLAGGESTADIVAASDLRLMSLPKKEFIEHLQHEPGTAISMLKCAGNRFKEMFTDNENQSAGHLIGMRQNPRVSLRA